MNQNDDLLLAIQARQAALLLQRLSSDERNQLLNDIHCELLDSSRSIVEANQLDLEVCSTYILKLICFKSTIFRPPES